MTPAIGMSPPMPLPQVSMSGTTFECWMAHILPVRPAPDCTSSATYRQPFFSQAALIISRNSGGGAT